MKTPEAPDTYSAAFVTLDDAPSTQDDSDTDDAGTEDTGAKDAGAKGTSTDDTGIEDMDIEGTDTEGAGIADIDQPVENTLSDDDDAPASGENLRFPDTFGASDVYHDDPPALDEDYSRSLGDGDELAAEQAAFAAQMQEDDEGMEAVGGMVRDAMERDPVDYADPSALVSMTSEEISARALASLADVEGETSRRVYGSLKISESDGGEESLEGMVRGMLKPMLREWLDDNLPTMVESAVRGEVERISSKSRKYSRAADND